MLIHALGLMGGLYSQMLETMLLHTAAPGGACGAHPHPQTTVKKGRCELERACNWWDQLLVSIVGNNCPCRSMHATYWCKSMCLPYTA